MKKSLLWLVAFSPLLLTAQIATFDNFRVYQNSNNYLIAEFETLQQTSCEELVFEAWQPGIAWTVMNNRLGEGNSTTTKSYRMAQNSTLYNFTGLTFFRIRALNFNGASFVSPFFTLDIKEYAFDPTTGRSTHMRQLNKIYHLKGTKVKIVE